MADPPGSGKTFVLLSLVLNDPKSCNIVVVPQNIYTQWIQSIEKFCGKALTYKKYISYHEISSLYFEQSNLSKYNILLTTPLYYSVIADALGKNIVDRVIIDEIDSIDLLVNKKAYCKILWFVSASFNNNILKTLKISQNPDEVKCQCSSDFVLQGFPLPPPEFITMRCENTYLDNILNGILTHNEFNAMNALDFTKMETKFNTRVAANEKEALEYLVADLQQTVQTLEQNIEDIDRKMGDCDDEIRQTSMMILKKKYHTDLQETQTKLDSITQRINDNHVCFICYDNITDKCITSCCKNSFCYECLLTWLKKSYTCPYCREKKIEVIRVLPDKPSKEEDFEEPPKKIDKFDLLKTLFTENKVGSKVIIFSDYSRVFNEITKILQEINIKHIELDGGNIGALDRDIDMYKTGDARVLMTNSSLYGCGMNLENTTDIIVMHKTNSSLYNQVIGRAQRPGRSCALKVWQLLHHNEQAI